MGAIPSRESLLRGLVCKSSAFSSATDAALECGEKSSTNKMPDLTLVPLIPDYFPSSDSVIFQTFLNACKDLAFLSTLKDRNYDTPSHCKSDEELYDYYMSISTQRLFETDSELLAVHRAGRVFSAVPCAVAFVEDSLPTQATASLPPVKDTIHGLNLHIIGFIGDTGFCPPSFPQSRAKSNPFQMRLFLSKKVGGNQRLLVTCLAAYTFITQLRRIGIVDHPIRMTSLYTTYESTDQENNNSTDLVKKNHNTHYNHDHCDDNSYGRSNNFQKDHLEESSNDWMNWEDANISGNVIFRSLEIQTSLTDIPWLCYLRETRARIAGCTVNNSMSDIGSLSSSSVLTYIEGESLCVFIDSSTLKKFVEWACWYMETRGSSLMGADAANLRAALSKSNDTIKGNVFIDATEPFGAETGDVWIIAPDAFAHDTLEEEYTHFTRGTVLYFDGANWTPRGVQYAEDILLAVCRDECRRARNAAPDDPHWVRHTSGKLLHCEAAVFHLWRFVKHGLQLTYVVSPEFAKRCRRDAHAEPATMTFTAALPHSTQITPTATAQTTTTATTTSIVIHPEVRTISMTSPITGEAIAVAARNVPTGIQTHIPTVSDSIVANGKDSLQNSYSALFSPMELSRSLPLTERATLAHHRRSAATSATTRLPLRTSHSVGSLPVHTAWYERWGPTEPPPLSTPHTVTTSHIPNPSSSMPMAIPRCASAGLISPHSSLHILSSSLLMSPGVGRKKKAVVVSVQGTGRGERSMRQKGTGDESVSSSVRSYSELGKYRWEWRH